jgi:STE24 endopeptidase
VEQLTESELEAVLAHEIGHYKRRHVPKMLIGSLAGMLVGFYVVAWLARQAWFVQAFGLEMGTSIAPAMLMFALLSGTISFWFAPIANRISRKFEYQADAFAVETTRDIGSLISALRKLNEKNLSNLWPHPLFSGFYYSHPSLVEREAALKSLGRTAR